MASHKAQAALVLWMVLTMTSLTSLTLANNDNRCNVQNQSSKTIILSTTYYNSIYTLYNGEQINVFTNDGTHTPFQNVVLTPGNDAVAIYNTDIWAVTLSERVDGNPVGNSFNVTIDRSVVAKDDPQKVGVQFYYLGYNSNNIDGGVILTIYPAAPPATPAPTQTPATPVATATPSTPSGPSTTNSPPAPAPDSGLDPGDDGDDDSGCGDPQESALATTAKPDNRMKAWVSQGLNLIPTHNGSGIYYALFPKTSNPCANCNAFAIDATHIMTAAHCVYDESSGSYTSTGAIVKLGKVGKATKGTTVKVKQCLVPPAFKSTGKSSDWAVCQVDNIGSIVPWTIEQLDTLGSGTYNLLTYPLASDSYPEGKEVWRKTPWQANYAQLASGSDNVLYLNGVTFDGDSGAAMFDNNDKVVAVHKGGSQGFIFTETIYGQIMDFINELN